MLDEVPRELGETEPTLAGQTWRLAEKEASRREYCADCQLGAIIGYSLPHGSRLPSPGGPDMANQAISCKRLTENELSDFSRLWHDGCGKTIIEAQDVEQNHSPEV